MSTVIITNSNTDDDIGNNNEHNVNDHNRGNNNEVLASVTIWRWSGGTPRLTLLV